ncbi:hypothetical protein jhhlp_006609 [Lomentospora prolificans]|uniref:AAA+ ATPase domain-containing protein n=1 Tax=Lomentospora prolificans TaxID=41688 RepID=A0A2N3N6F9_9PEZI|nr:hypothetical protein jhhlp_006609 [Lomentospora prolificans]
MASKDEEIKSDLGTEPTVAPREDSAVVLESDGDPVANETSSLELAEPNPVESTTADGDGKGEETEDFVVVEQTKAGDEDGDRDGGALQLAPPKLAAQREEAGGPPDTTKEAVVDTSSSPKESEESKPRKDKIADDDMSQTIPGPTGSPQENVSDKPDDESRGGEANDDGDKAINEGDGKEKDVVSDSQTPTNEDEWEEVEDDETAKKDGGKKLTAKYMLKRARMRRGLKTAMPRHCKRITPPQEPVSSDPDPSKEKAKAADGDGDVKVDEKEEEEEEEENRQNWDSTVMASHSWYMKLVSDDYEEGVEEEEEEEEKDGNEENSSGSDSSSSSSESENDYDDEPELVEDDSAARAEWLRQKPNIWRRNRGLDRIMCMVGVEKVKQQFLSMKASIEASQRRGEKLHGSSIAIEVTGGPGTGKYVIKEHFGTFKDDLYDWSDDDLHVDKSHRTTRNIHIDDYTEDELHTFLKRFFKKRGLEAEGGVGGFYTEILARKVAIGRGIEGFRNFWAIRDAFTEACDRQADRLYAERLEWEKNGSQGDPPDDRFVTKEDLMGKPPPDLRETSEAYKELQRMVGMEHIKAAVEELMDRARVNYRLQMKGKKLIRTHLNRVILGPPGTGKTTVAHLYGRILCDLNLVSKGEVVAKDPSDFMSKWIGGPQDNTKTILEETKGKVLIIDDAHTLCPTDDSANSSFRGDQYRFEILDTIVAKTSTKPGQDRAIIMIGYSDQMHALFAKANPGLRSRFPLEDAFELKDYSLPHLISIFDKSLIDLETEVTPVARDVASQMLGRARDRPNFGNARDVENLVNRARAAYRERIQAERAKKHAKKAEVEVKVTVQLDGEPVKPVSSGLPNGVAAELADPAALKIPKDDAIEVEKENTAGTPADDAVQTSKEDITEVPKVEPTEATKEPEFDRFELEDRVVLEPDDFDPNWRRADGAGSSCEDLFKEFVGFDKVVQQFRGYQQIASGMRLHGRDPRPYVPFTFIFKGPPGTGKTSTARLIGQIFYDMGFLASNEVVECSATDLIGQFKGHTGPKVQGLMEKGLGKILFIDEAYRLGGDSSFNEEAVGELVDCLTKQRYMQKMVVILAGYSEDMDMLMKSNRGLRGRFSTEVVFPQLTPAQCLLFLGQLLAKMDIAIRDRTAPSPEEKAKVQRLLAKLSATRDWANGRDIETLSRKIVGEVYMSEGRKGRKSTRLQVSTREMIVFLQDMLRARLAGELQDRE